MCNAQIVVLTCIKRIFRASKRCQRCQTGVRYKHENLLQILFQMKPKQIINYSKIFPPISPSGGLLVLIHVTRKVLTALTPAAAADSSTDFRAAPSRSYLMVVGSALFSLFSLRFFCGSGRFLYGYTLCRIFLLLPVLRKETERQLLTARAAEHPISDCSQPVMTTLHRFHMISSCQQ